MTYYVSQYDEGPIEPRVADEFATLEDARACVARHTDAAPNTSLAGEQYADDSRHVEAYYDDDAHQSSGWWITARD